MFFKTVQLLEAILLRDLIIIVFNHLITFFFKSQSYTPPPPSPSYTHPVPSSSSCLYLITLLFRKKYIKSQILVHEYWTKLDHFAFQYCELLDKYQPFIKNIIITFSGNTGTPKMFQYSHSIIWELKYTFPLFKSQLYTPPPPSPQVPLPFSGNTGTPKMFQYSRSIIFVPAIHTST